MGYVQVLYRFFSFFKLNYLIAPISKEETFEKIKLLCFRQNKATLATNEMLGWNKKPRRNWC